MKHLPGFCLAILPALLVGCSDDSDNRPTAPPPEPEPVACAGEEVNPERLFLQQLGSDRVIVKWRGDADGGEGADALCFGTDMAFLPEASLTAATETETGHREVLLTGLSPETTYYYSVGGAGEALEKRHFRTAPETGQLPEDGNVRLWIIGDSGIGGKNLPETIEQVQDGFNAFVENSGGEVADLFLMLGDNAYNQGTDLEHQRAIFDIFPDILSNTPLWPVIGNHEMGSFGVSTSSDPDSFAIIGNGNNGGPDPAPDSPMPYLNIFTLPTDGEVGGLASGTEQYYSFDYANVHIVALDTQLAMRDEDGRAAMKQWLMDDLASNDLDWTVVMFHHPPYTKGDHDSDNPIGGDTSIFVVREEFTPVFEEYGVDLVYSGHSHIYERSYYLKGHTGLSDTFDPQVHAELNDDGQAANGQGDEAYTQIARNGTDDKVVYTVAGHAGDIRSAVDPNPHPAHFYSRFENGSVVLDIGENRLEARSIDANGEVMDSFVMTR